MNTLRILLVGDVVGNTGRMMFQKHIQRIKSEYQLDGIIVNGENSGGRGRGITPRIAKFFKHNGAHVITTGNHVWRQKEIYSYLETNTDVLRPANFPVGAPGVGVTTVQVAGVTIGVVNLQGRVFMSDHIDCPFRTAKSILTYLHHKTNLVFVDFHAETTSEKMAMGHFLDGQVTAVVGTHTHVQTADERILPHGTAFITDLGMVGSLNGMLGMKREPIIEHFLKQLPVKFEVDTSLPIQLCGVMVIADVQTGKAVSIRRVTVLDSELIVGSDELDTER